MSDDLLHKEVVTGIVRIIVEINKMMEKGQKTFNFQEMFDVGTEGASERAKTYINEFLKDGMYGLTTSIAEKVANGDYEDIWRSTNRYLARFGYEMVNPVPIEL